MKPDNSFTFMRLENKKVVYENFNISNIPELTPLHKEAFEYFDSSFKFEFDEEKFKKIKGDQDLVTRQLVGFKDQIYTEFYYGQWTQTQVAENEPEIFTRHGKGILYNKQKNIEYSLWDDGKQVGNTRIITPRGYRIDNFDGKSTHVDIN